MNWIKKAILKLDKYVIPQDLSRIKLNQNESPVDIPVEIKEEIFERLREVNWNRYPSADASSLVDKIADYTCFSSSGIIVGNGSNEMIQTLVYSICDSGDEILVIQPGFSIYKRVASVVNIRVREVPLRENFSFNVEDIIEKGKKVKMVILASPNNPTGTALQVKEIAEIAGNIKGIVAVDEAYYEFYRETAQSLIDQLKNIIVFRTFSKALNLAGIRLGYFLGRKEITDELFKAKLPFSLGIFQQVAGEVILERRRFIELNLKEIVKERERLYKELRKIKNIHPVPSCANFILFESKNWSGKDLYAKLYEKGVVLRFFDTPRLKNMLRVTIGSHAENDVFLDKMRQLFNRGLS